MSRLRPATPEEKEVINARGNGCYMIMDYGDIAKACPNSRIPGTGTCEIHTSDKAKELLKATTPEAKKPTATVGEGDGTMATKKGKTTKKAATKTTKKAVKKAEGTGGKCDICKEVRKTTRTTREGVRRCLGCWRKQHGRKKK